MSMSIFFNIWKVCSCECDHVHKMFTLSRYGRRWLASVKWDGHRNQSPCKRNVEYRTMLDLIVFDCLDVLWECLRSFLDVLWECLRFFLGDHAFSERDGV